MSTLSFHQGRPRLAEPELPPTLTPNPIHAASRAPSRTLSALGSLLVYGVFAVCTLALAQGVAHEPRRVETRTIQDVILNPSAEDRVATVRPPMPERAPIRTENLTRPADWKPIEKDDSIPDVAPNTMPTRDDSLAHLFSKDMAVAKPGESATGAGELLRRGVTSLGSGTTSVQDVDYRQLRVLHQAPVHYPPMARLARVQGPVEVLITIDPNGVPVQVEANGGHPSLQAEAMRCAREWRFEPARVDGQPVSARFRLTIQFRLQ